MTSPFRRYLILFLIILGGYLCQVCVMPYIKIWGVTPNLLYVLIGIVTVAYGKLQAFWVGASFGILMQIMLPSVSYMNLALYSLTALFCSFPFADKPLKTLEYERATNRTRRELPAWLRTLLCTAANILIFEAVSVIYIYLGGNEITAAHILRALLDIVLTSLLALLLMFPLRRVILGRRASAKVFRIAPVIFHRR